MFIQAEKINNFEKLNNKSLEEVIWKLCQNYFEYTYQFQEQDDYYFFKHNFAKSLTVKILNNSEFTDLLLSKFNDNKIFYFKTFDEYELAMFYVKDKNIVVKKTNFNFKSIVLKIALYALQHFKNKKEVKEKIIFLSTLKKYRPMFNFCEKNIKDKSEILYVNNIRHDLFKKLSLNVKKNKNYFPSFLNKTKSETLINILITYNIIKTYLKKSKCKAIISVEGDSIEHSIISYVCGDRLKKISFQWGAFTKNYLKNGFKFMYQDVYFVWSNYYAKKFKEYNQKTKFLVSGNNLLDLRIKNNKKDIIFLLSAKEVFISNKTEIKIYELIKWVKKFDNKNIIVRFHPSDNEKRINYIQNKLKNTKIIFHYPEKITLMQSIKNSVVAIGIRSSSLIEVSKLGIIPIIINDNEVLLEDYFNDIEKIGLAHDGIRSTKKILNKIFFNSNYYSKKVIQVRRISNKYIKFIDIRSKNIINEQLKILKI
jgi:hypothetical protein